MPIGPPYQIPDTRSTGLFQEASRFGKHNVVQTGGWIRSGDWDGDDDGNGSTEGWYVGGDGATVVFNEGEFRGNIIGASIDIGGSDATSFHVDTSGNAWLGASSFATSPFRISNTGDLDVGGTDASSFHVDNTGRMWLGDGSFASAPFKVTAAGVLTASGATITGTLKTAESGERIEISSADQSLIAFQTGDADQTGRGRIEVDVGGSGGTRYAYLWLKAPTIRDAVGDFSSPSITIADESYDNSQAAFISMFASTTDAISVTSGGDILLNSGSGNVVFQAPGGHISTGDEMRVGSLMVASESVSFGAADSAGAGFRLLRVPN